VAALVVALAAAWGGGGGPELRASPVEPARDAPLTRGRDHDGAPISLPIEGRPAVVTFLFAACPDVCPLAAQTISQSLDRLGARASEIDVLAVSVDPAGDTPDAVAAFLRRHRLEGRTRYLVGTQAALEPIWRSWMVAAQPAGAAGSIHSARIVLVDREGRQAGSYPAGVPVPLDDLAADMEALVDS
jgi:protein SCO1